MSSAPYFSSRKRSTYTFAAIHPTAAAHGNRTEMRRALQNLDTRMEQLETRAGGGSISLKTSSPVSSAPPLASVGASAAAGVFRVQITNPQFRTVKKANLPNTPMLHEVAFSKNGSFGDAVALPITNQTYIENSQFGAGARRWVRVRSSFDGKTFNDSQVLGPFQA